MMMVDRYEMYFDDFDDYVTADVEDDGEWVRYDDYKAQAARIEQLEVALATARNDALREAAGWHMDVAKHDASGMEYSSLVGIPISNWSELDTSVKTHEFCAREILALITKEAP